MPMRFSKWEQLSGLQIEEFVKKQEWYVDEAMNSLMILMNVKKMPIIIAITSDDNDDDNEKKG